MIRGSFAHRITAHTHTLWTWSAVPFPYQTHNLFIKVISHRIHLENSWNRKPCHFATIPQENSFTPQKSGYNFTFYLESKADNRFATPMHLHCVILFFGDETNMYLGQTWCCSKGNPTKCFGCFTYSSHLCAAQLLLLITFLFRAVSCWTFSH